MKDVLGGRGLRGARIGHSVARRPVRYPNFDEAFTFFSLLGTDSYCPDFYRAQTIGG